VADIATRLGLHHIRPRADSAVAINDLWCGRLEDAEKGFSEALELWRGVGYRTGVAQTLRNLAEVRLEAAAPREARLLASEALGIAEEDDLHWNLSGAHVTLGWIALDSADFDGARSQFRQVRAMPPSGQRYWLAFANLGLATCQRVRGDHDSAAELAGQALRDPRPRVQAAAHRELAMVRLARGDSTVSFEHVRSALVLARHCGYRLDEARALEVRGELYDRAGKRAAAAAARAQARSIFSGARS
jgi:tetratricopeptide (TPR) repeat protein